MRWHTGASANRRMFLIPATAQMTFKYYNPHTKQAVWKSVNVGNFKHEGKSCKSDQFVSLDLSMCADAPRPSRTLARPMARRRTPSLPSLTRRSRST